MAKLALSHNIPINQLEKWTVEQFRNYQMMSSLYTKIEAYEHEKQEKEMKRNRPNASGNTHGENYTQKGSLLSLRDASKNLQKTAGANVKK